MVVLPFGPYCSDSSTDELKILSPACRLVLSLRSLCSLMSCSPGPVREVGTRECQEGPGSLCSRPLLLSGNLLEMQHQDGPSVCRGPVYPNRDGAQGLSSLLPSANLASNTSPRPVVRLRCVGETLCMTDRAQVPQR